MFRSAFLFSLSFLWVLCCNAQRNESENGSKTKLKHQLELGMNYTVFLGTNTNFDGLGTAYGIEWKPYDATEGGLPFIRSNEYFAYKLIYRHHVLKYDFHAFFSELRAPVIDIISKSYKIHSLGYGYCFFINKRVLITPVIQVCHRVGNEYATPHIPSLDIRLVSGMDYQKPLGFSIGSDIEYLFTKNIGLGCNVGYYFFPFENARLTGGEIEYYNPVMQQTTLPTKQMLVGTIKLYYRFELPWF